MQTSIIENHNAINFEPTHLHNFKFQYSNYFKSVLSYITVETSSFVLQ